MTTPASDAATRAIGRLLRPVGAEAARTADPEVHVPSRPETVVWGELPVRRAPVAIVDPGARVRVDTVSHQGMTTEVTPVAFFGAFGIGGASVLADVIDIHRELAAISGPDAHVLTGPIAIRGARPGDALEVRVLAAGLRVPYGVNFSRPGGGVLPDLLDRPATRLLELDRSGTRLDFAPGVSVPVRPFPGILAVAPTDADAVDGRVRSKVPGRFGGNLDVKAMTVGARLFLPVLQPDAGFYIGDPHSAQGDGEVNGTAVEHSSTYTLEFRLHRGLGPHWPIVVTPTHLLALGLDPDVGRATALALRAAVDLVVGFSDGSLGEEDAYALCSVAGDVGIAEAVNLVSVAQVAVPRELFHFEARQPPST